MLRQAESFQRVLAQPSLARTHHFAAHYLAASDLDPVRPKRGSADAGAVPATELSSGADATSTQPVDNSEHKSVDKQGMAGGISLGLVVPKRHARRAVTRNLIKRQMRQVLVDRLAEHASGLPGGHWVLRLRVGFDRALYPSAASDALKKVARSELTALVNDAATRAARRASHAPKRANSPSEEAS